MTVRFFAIAMLMSATFACGGGNDKDNVTPTFIDSGMPDAPSKPDAMPCNGTVCDELCVDTTSDPFNCGGCGMTCASPGQVCNGSLPCECPPDFVPASVGGGFDQIQEQMGVKLALSPVLGPPFNLVVVAYDLDLETGVDYNLADGPANLEPPGVAAGYDVNIANQTAKTPYGAFQGTIRFDSICADGVSGTITDVVFNEVEGVFNPVPVADGCSMSFDSITFAIGANCPANP
jgi:hypothetical protein